MKIIEKKLLCNSMQNVRGLTMVVLIMVNAILEYLTEERNCSPKGLWDYRNII